MSGKIEPLQKTRKERLRVQITAARGEGALRAAVSSRDAAEERIPEPEDAQRETPKTEVQREKKEKDTTEHPRAGGQLWKEISGGQEGSARWKWGTPEEKRINRRDSHSDNH